jgi:hypothetical protein
VTVKVSTTAPEAALAIPQIKFPPATTLWVMLALALGCFSHLLAVDASPWPYQS